MLWIPWALRLLLNILDAHLIYFIFQFPLWPLGGGHVQIYTDFQIQGESAWRAVHFYSNAEMFKKYLAVKYWSLRHIWIYCITYNIDIICSWHFRRKINTETFRINAYVSNCLTGIIHKEISSQTALIRILLLLHIVICQTTYVWSQYCTKPCLIFKLKWQQTLKRSNTATCRRKMTNISSSSVSRRILWPLWIGTRRTYNLLYSETWATKGSCMKINRFNSVSVLLHLRLPFTLFLFRYDLDMWYVYATPHKEKKSEVLASVLKLLKVSSLKHTQSRKHIHIWDDKPGTTVSNANRTTPSSS